MDQEECEVMQGSLRVVEWFSDTNLTYMGMGPKLTYTGPGLTHMGHNLTNMGLKLNQLVL